MLSRLGKIGSRSLRTHPGRSTSLLRSRAPIQRRHFTSEKESGNKNDNKLNVPKGFEGFFGKDAGKSTTSKRSSDPKKPSEESSKSDNSSNKKSSNGGGKPPDLPPINTNMVLGTAFGTWLLWKLTSPDEGSSREVTWQGFRTQLLDKGVVDRLVVVNRNRVRVHLRPESSSLGVAPQQTFTFSIGSVDSFEHKLDLAQQELGIPSAERIPVAYQDEVSVLNTALHFAPTLLLIGVLYYITKKGPGGAGGAGGGIFGIGKSKAKMFNQETDVKVKFKHVAGADEAKEEIMEFVKFLKNPALYEKLGATIPRGAILSGKR
jgi:AFG3 family protein